MTAERPFTMLIAALGGEGGGLLTDWIVEACRTDGLLIQTTSIPGVAQRTGATTYYLEMMHPLSGHGLEPLFALFPAPGFIDMAVASEIVEAGRLIEMGFVTPDRTTLIASTHRVYAMAERTAMADGAYDAPRIADAANALAASAILKDFASLAQAEATAINAVLLGAISATAGCPISIEAFETAIRQRGVAADANLRGFAAGRALVLGEIESPSTTSTDQQGSAQTPDALHAKADAFPDEARDVIHAGIDRLLDYQDTAYAELYLERLGPITSIDKDPAQNHHLTRETARYLALWMAYEDVIRVADLKTRRTRFERLRDEVGAKPDEPVRITEFLKPGIEELATLLPPGIARRLTAWADRRGLTAKLRLPLHVRTDSIWGYTVMRIIARLRTRRRKGLRYVNEQKMIERWLKAIERAAARSPGLACETAECGRLIKGYGDTRARANMNFDLILTAILEPALDGNIDPDHAARWMHTARDTALADEDGVGLADTVSGFRRETGIIADTEEKPHAVQAAE